MTWNVSAAGHHSSSDWEAEEKELLHRIMDAIDGSRDVICSSFSFAGNYVSVSNPDDARAKIAEWEQE